MGKWKAERENSEQKSQSGKQNDAMSLLLVTWIENLRLRLRFKKTQYSGLSTRY